MPRGAKILAVIFLFACVPLHAQESVAPYKNPHLAIPDRVADLLSRMTVEERVAEITGGHHDDRGLVDTTGQLPYKTADEVFAEMYRTENKITPRERALAHNALQRFQREKTRLGIPSIFFGEALHGYMAYGSTSVPQALALASTWDPALVRLRMPSDCTPISAIRFTLG